MVGVILVLVRKLVSFFIDSVKVNGELIFLLIDRKLLILIIWLYVLVSGLFELLCLIFVLCSIVL